MCNVSWCKRSCAEHMSGLTCTCGYAGGRGEAGAVGSQQRDCSGAPFGKAEWPMGLNALVASAVLGCLAYMLVLQLAAMHAACHDLSLLTGASMGCAKLLLK